MNYTPECRSFPEAYLMLPVNSFFRKIPESFKAQNPEYVKTFFEKTFHLPQAQSHVNVNRVLKIYSTCKLYPENKQKIPQVHDCCSTHLRYQNRIAFRQYCYGIVISLSCQTYRHDVLILSIATAPPRTTSIRRNLLLRSAINSLFRRSVSLHSKSTLSLPISATCT